MKVKDIDIDKIEQLINSIPEDLEVNSINLRVGYQLELTKSYSESSEERKQAALDNLMKMIDNLKNAEIMRNNETEGKPL